MKKSFNIIKNLNIKTNIGKKNEEERKSKIIQEVSSNKQKIDNLSPKLLSNRTNEDKKFRISIIFSMENCWLFILEDLKKVNKNLNQPKSLNRLGLHS